MWELLKETRGYSISKSRIALSKPNLLHWLGLDYSYHETVNKGHHRPMPRDSRRAVPVSQLPLLHRQEQWAGLTTVVMVWSQGQLWNKTTTEVRFYISSLDADSAIIRLFLLMGVLKIQSNWVLDVT